MRYSIFFITILLIINSNLFARSIEEQISFEIDSIKFAKYLDESDSSIAQFYRDFSNNKITEVSLNLEDSKFCVKDSVDSIVTKEYKPYDWVLGGIISGAILNIIGGTGVLIANEKIDHKSNDKINNLSIQCPQNEAEIKNQQDKIRFKYTACGVVAGILLNALIVYYQTKDN